MISKIAKSILILSVALMFFLPSIAGAVTYTEEDVRKSEDLLGLKYGAASGLSDADVRYTAGRVINVALSLLGIIFVGLTVYAGFLWMTARGDDDGVKDARQTLTAAVIGLVIVLSAYAISNFVLRSGSYATSGVGVESRTVTWP